MRHLTPAQFSMPRQRDHVRDFPGRRGLNLGLRSLHLAGIVLLGAALLGAGDITVSAWLTLLSGAGMFAGDAWTNPGHVREVAGCGVLLKLALVVLMAFVPALALPVFWMILVLSTLLSHAPGALRHKRLF